MTENSTRDCAVLVVDDNPDTRETMRLLLCDKGYRVRTAAEGREALALASVEAPDIFVLDVRMPGMSGLDLLRRLSVRTRDCEAVIVTGHQSLADAQTAMELGARSYLTKPVRADDLYSHVAQAFEALTHARRERLRIDALRRQALARERELAATLKILDHKDLLLDALFSSIGEGLLAVDGDNTVVLLNPAAERILGIRYAECAGKPLEAVLHDGELTKKLVPCLAGPGLSRRETIRISTPGGHSRWYFVGVSDFRDRAGDLRGKIVNLVDQTEFLRAQEYRETFLTLLAHELRTPVTIINSYASLLRTADASPEARDEMLAELQATGRRLRDLIANIIALATLGSPTAKSETVPVKLGPLIRFQTDRLRGEAQERSIDVRVDDALDAEQVVSDPHVLGTAVRALVSNGIKHNRLGGRLDIALEPGESGVDVIAVSFTDQGSGLPAAAREYLFGDPGRSMVLSEESKEGLGAGLYLVKRAMTLVGGRIEIGGGSAGARVVLVLSRGFPRRPD